MIAIEHEPPQALADEIARLYFEAFKAKLGPIFGTPEHAARVFRRAIHPPMFIVALCDGQLCGVAALAYRGQHALEVKFKHLVAEYGWLRAVFKLALLMLLHYEPASDEVYLDTLVVDARFRGQGIGTLLLKEVEGLARQKGILSIRLDVVDTNPRAKALYERAGFTIETHVRVPGMDRFLGFGGYTTMAKGL
jgi:ribosomal protein S18 acetylase RimI-like enzyme